MTDLQLAVLLEQISTRLEIGLRAAFVSMQIGTEVEGVVTGARSAEQARADLGEPWGLMLSLTHQAAQLRGEQLQAPQPEL